MINILLATSSEIVKKGFISLLINENDMKILHVAATDLDMFDMVLRDNFDVVIMDVDLIGRGPIETLDDLRAISPGIPVIVLSSVSDDTYLWNIFKAGATGYLKKDAEPQEFRDTIRRVSDMRPSSQ
ncbi:MAG: response regulator transcription factor [Ignavibacteria bacterium]|jgi:DNA-binding NarL/FixJ family response regulator|nr:response regulator transcription factor [Ignavibacteria bacterium]MCU7501770.1 response regulator transcription factor [Ignavibacteria bacterium]MCU7516823.1 response regulator transcription factor [Ignavibacteria bacterium]